MATSLPDIWNIAKQLPGNVDNIISGASDVATKINDRNSAELLKRLESVMPGASEALKKSGATALDLVSGIIPQDVIDNIRNNNAAWQVSSGAGDYGVGNARLSRSLGLTSLDLKNQGLSQLGATANLARGAFMPTLVGTETNIPNLSDSYNNEATKALAQMEQDRFNQNLALAREGIGRGNVGGGSGGGISRGGGGYSTNPTGYTPAGIWETPSWTGDTHGTGWSSPSGGAQQTAGQWSSGTSKPDWLAGLDNAGLEDWAFLLGDNSGFNNPSGSVWGGDSIWNTPTDNTTPTDPNSGDQSWLWDYIGN